MWSRLIINPGFWSGLMFPYFTYRIRNAANAVFLTFDDGPHPEITPYVLDVLEQHGAKATFFLLGCNAMRYPHLVDRILADGHAIGNHSYSHPNGWNTSTESYCADVAKAGEVLETALFRPPYGRIKPAQSRILSKKMHVVMWDVMSHDYHPKVTPAKCLSNVIANARAGSVVVFHENDKAFQNLQATLPLVLLHFQKKGFVFQCIKEAMLKG